MSQLYIPITNNHKQGMENIVGTIIQTSQGLEVKLKDGHVIHKDMIGKVFGQVATFTKSEDISPEGFMNKFTIISWGM